tara:strand:- start:13 stop:1161 length:1149 start_codon:yes stop_codon:yes gene_type:complete
MATWRKVIVSGSNAELNHISSSGNFVPVETDGGALGSAGLNWSDLFLDSGAVVNFDNGNVTLTHESGKIVTSGDVSGSVFTTGSFGRLELAGDAVINGNLTFGDANTDSVSFGAEIDSNLIPNEDDTYDLGSATKAWQDLFLEGDITLTDAGSVKTSAGNLTVDSEAGNLVLDGHTGVDIDATNSGKVSIDGAGGIDIGVASDVAIDIDSSTLDIDASGNVTIDASGGSINIGGGSSGRAITIGHTTSEVTIGDNITVSGNATITGNLDVNGTLTTIDTANLSVKDQLIFAASGSSASNLDAGLLVQSGSVAGSGSAFYHDINSERWAVAKSVAEGQTAVTPLQFVTTTTLNTTAPNETSGSYGVGEMWVETDTQDIYIRTN